MTVQVIENLSGITLVIFEKTKSTFYYFINITVYISPHIFLTIFMFRMKG